MNIDFRHGNSQFMGFDTESDEWEALEISESDKENIISNAINDKTVKSREAAYKKESEPLYMKWQYDQTFESEQAWRAKVSEIDAHYPFV